MKELQDLSSNAIEEYKKLVDSGLFTERELENWLSGVTDSSEMVGIGQRRAGYVVGRSEETLRRWKQNKYIKAYTLGREQLYDADELIRMKKILKVERGKIIWR